MSDPVVNTIYRWTTDYAVGVGEIDEDHQAEFALAERMHLAMLEGKGKAILEDLLARLVEHTHSHFAHEEQLMERIRYPSYRQHQQEHADLCSKVRAMRDRSASGEKTMTIEVMQFIIDWLKDHTITSDQRFGEYMKTSATYDRSGNQSSP
jgi:hemerythrin